MLLGPLDVNDKDRYIYDKYGKPIYFIKRPFPYNDNYDSVPEYDENVNFIYLKKDSNKKLEWISKFQK